MSEIEAFGIGPSGSTPTLGLPYPTPDDTVDVPRDVKALADRLDLELGGGGTGGGVIVAKPVLDVGVAGQIRAGRQLAATDFTTLGLVQPIGLFSLSNVNNAGSDARALTNKGAVAFGAGIEGIAATAAVFAGSTAQAFYITDSGAADPFRIKTGSWGCWFRTAKRGGPQQYLLSKQRETPAVSYGWGLSIAASNVLVSSNSLDGATVVQTAGVTDVCDDRWHFAVVAFDGTAVRLYLDGVLDGTGALSGALFASTAPFNIGGYNAEAAIAATTPHFGRIDEAFITDDVLTEDQIRVLYAVKTPHTLGAVPSGVRLNVHRLRKGAPLVVGDFTTPPLRLHNFTGAALTDAGSNGVALTNNGVTGGAAGADGSSWGAIHCAGTNASATDASLPTGLAARSYGCWFKTITTTTMNVMAWGVAATGDARLYMLSNQISAASAGDSATGPVVNDGVWHHAVVVEDNGASDGVRRKLYVDGRLAGASTVMNPITLAGANSFRVGANSAGGGPFAGQIDGVFVCGYAMTAAEVMRVYAKGSRDSGASPKNAGDHVERVDSTDLYFIGDTLESQYVVDIDVVA